MVKVLLFLIPFALTIYSVIDAIQTEDTQVRHLPKVVWILMILLTAPSGVGAIAWLVIGRQHRPRTGPRYPTAPRGPDDDPDFLRTL